MESLNDFDVSSIPTEFNPLHTLDGGGSDSLYANDDKLYVTFATEAVLNPSASTKAGRPIYDDIDMITIRTPGSQLTSIVHPAKKYVPGRPVLAEKYRLWKAGQEEKAGGTPLENFPFLFTKPSLIAELKYRNVFTVEQLATLSDGAKQSVMGGHELCKKAQEWLDSTAANAVDAEKEAMANRVAQLEELVKQLSHKTTEDVAAAKLVTPVAQQKSQAVPVTK
jgi:hypothetical protein